MPIFEVQLDPPLLETEVEAESAEDAMVIALGLFEEKISDGTWVVREVEE